MSRLFGVLANRVQWMSQSYTICIFGRLFASTEAKGTALIRQNSWAGYRPNRFFYKILQCLLLISAIF